MKSFTSVALWICTAALILLGALGLLEKVTPLKLKRSVWIVLLIAFFAFSVGQVVLSLAVAKRAPEDFYAQEVTEIYPRNEMNGRLTFTTDADGNKCAIFALKKIPIPNTVHLWEGGYHAPPVTLSIDRNKVVFKFSAFSTLEDYAQGRSLYQIKYIPKP